MLVNGISKGSPVAFKAELKMDPYRASITSMDKYWASVATAIRNDKSYDTLQVRAKNPSMEYSSDGVEFIMTAQRGEGKKMKSSKTETVTVKLGEEETAESFKSTLAGIQSIVSQVAKKGLFGSKK